MTVRSVARGLSPEELEHIRAGLAAGRRPKVVFTEAAGQIVGQLGQVVELTDPTRSEEWVVVRFGRDELPFSPADLAVAPKGAAARRPAKAAKRTTAAAAEAPGAPLLPPAEPAPPPAAATTAAPPARPAAEVSGSRQAGAGTRPADSAGTSATAAQAGGGGRKAVAPEGAERPGRTAAKVAARKAGRGRQPSALTVTVAYADGEWTVAAHQGGKVLAKPYLIKATEALKMVGMLDVAGVQEAVDEIVAADRAEAEAMAERLRAELAEVEARLAELRDAP